MQTIASVPILVSAIDFCVTVQRAGGWAITCSIREGDDTHPLDLADFLITISSKSGGISLIIAQ
ncbi:MAG: hypothetical protein OXU96_10945 [Gammaproteobacteria bacterium]|nr:hypothetical protein [Gammaproteobacteria bacterium]